MCNRWKESGGAVEQKILLWKADNNSYTIMTQIDIHLPILAVTLEPVFFRSYYYWSTIRDVWGMKRSAEPHLQKKGRFCSRARYHCEMSFSSATRRGPQAWSWARYHFCQQMKNLACGLMILSILVYHLTRLIDRKDRAFVRKVAQVGVSKMNRRPAKRAKMMNHWQKYERMSRL